MLEVALLTSCPDPLWRQLPGGDKDHHGVRFLLEREPAECDLCVVYHDIDKPMSVACRSGLAVLVTVEPEILTSHYPQAFLDQFDAVLSFRQDLKHPAVYRCPPMIPWWVGVSGGHRQERRVNLVYEDLQKNIDPAEKRLACSVICSSLAYTANHRARLDFVNQLCDRSQQIDRFGFGHRPIDDKWQAMRDYRVHVGIENSSCPDYWTEKAADAFLSECLLVYWGCPNLEDYFPQDAFVRLDLGDVDGAVALLEEVCAKGFYERRRPAILEAKRLVLERYNLFTSLADQLPKISKGEPGIRQMKPQNWYQGSLRKRFKRRWKHYTGGALRQRKA